MLFFIKSTLRQSDVFFVILTKEPGAAANKIAKEEKEYLSI